jgi:hypothetical protein
VVTTTTTATMTIEGNDDGSDDHTLESGAGGSMPIRFFNLVMFALFPARFCVFLAPKRSFGL